MEFLLDTHVFLWFSEDNLKLSKRAKSLIEDTDNKCLISIASIWEMAIKISLNKLKINIGFENLINELYKHDFDILPITFEHTVKLTTMDFHHRDPFDRILIAQSLFEDLSIISADIIFDKYDIKRIW